MALPLGYPEMVLGTTIELPHIDGKPLIISIPPNSRPSETIVIRDRGMPHRRNRGRGNVTILLKLHLPNKVDKAMKGQLEELREAFGLPTEDVEDAVRREANDRRG
jgi:molecular chaperone DnaJ